MTIHRPKNFHVNWRAYITRRVLILTVFSVIGYALEYTLHLYLAGKAAEMSLGAVLGHCLLEVDGG